MGGTQKDQKNDGTQGTNGGTGGSQTDDLELDADDDVDGGTGNDSGDDNDNDDDSIEAQIRRGIAAALPEITKGFQSEMDRRINGVVKKLKPAQRQQQDDDGDEDGDDPQPKRRRQSAPAMVEADERGARVAFRDYLSIKFLSDDERRMAMEYGSLLIGAEARKGFDDEDEVGRVVADKVATHVKNQRKFYADRTRRTLERQGVLIKQEGNGGGGNAGGGTPPPSTDQAWKAAEAKRRQLFPQQFADKK